MKSALETGNVESVGVLLKRKMVNAELGHKINPFYHLERFPAQVTLAVVCTEHQRLFAATS